MVAYQYPFRGKFRTTCPFGKVGSWSAGWHIGVDFVGDENKTVYPIASGTVKSINAHGASYGNHVTIRHPDGMTSLYAHLKNIAVKVGEVVDLNTPLGLMGATGNVTGAHLHLELHKGGWRYPPKKSNPDSAPWIVDPKGWIEDHIKEAEEVPEIKNLSISVKGKLTTVKAVNIDGNNYVLLRDVPKLVPTLEVGYDETLQMPKIE